MSCWSSSMTSSMSSARATRSTMHGKSWSIGPAQTASSTPSKGGTIFAMSSIPSSRKRSSEPRLRDIHQPYDFFEYSSGPLPPEDVSKIDVAILDMNHAWPNVGHDSLVHAVLECAESMRDELVSRSLKVRVISFDVRRQLAIPPSPNGRFRLYIGTGG